MSNAVHDRLFETIEALVMCHSPSGAEGEIDTYLIEEFAKRGLSTTMDAAGNIIAKIEGRGSGSIAITAHKDEIAAIVTAVEDDGCIRVRKLGGSFPWVYGEGVVDLLGDVRTVQGILSFGSRHVSHASPQFAFKETAPVKWTDVVVQTMSTGTELAQAGVRAGTRMVVGKHRKRPMRLGDHIASYALDDKAGLAALLELAARVRDPSADIFLVASAKEEVGALGALHFTQRQELDALVALEVAPIAPEYTIKDTAAPVLFFEDSFGLYDEKLNGDIRDAASRLEIPLQLAVVAGFGSDASICMKEGHVPRAACLGFPTHNTHGFEIAPIAAIANIAEILAEYCASEFQADRHEDGNARP